MERSTVPFHSWNNTLCVSGHSRWAAIQGTYEAWWISKCSRNTGLILCSDGVQLFKSSQQTLWPIVLAVTSLPPGILILAGVWQGSVKPPMEKILSPLLEKLQILKDDGIDVQTPNGLKTVRACLLMGVFELPAKANHTQFNGYNGCIYCLDKGTHTSHRHLYQPHQPRTSRHHRQCAREAEDRGEVVLGVKGKSVLIDHIDIVEAVPVDYIHAVLEGVTKQLITCWLNTKFHSHRFYLGLSVHNIDKKLLRIKPPPRFSKISPIYLELQIMESIWVSSLVTIL